MNSAIFRRSTRKGCGCTRGGAMSELNQQKKNLAGLEKQLARANSLGLTSRVRQDLTQRRNAKKARVNALQAASQNTGILSAITNKVQNAVQVVKNNVTKAQNAVIKTNNAMQSASVQQANIAAETAVVAANAAVNKSKNLAALANRANTLARNIRSMMGGKRNKHRTHRK